MPSKKLQDFCEADCDQLQRVKGCLHQRGYTPHRTLASSVERGVVMVQGRAPTFHLRQSAVEWVKRVAGVAQVKVANGPNVLITAHQPFLTQ